MDPDAGIEKGDQVPYRQIDHRFCVSALKMGLITVSQLQEAITTQFSEEIEGNAHRLTSRILIEKGDIQPDQIREVMKHMGYPSSLLP
jgi:hypothetical protein